MRILSFVAMMAVLILAGRAHAQYAKIESELQTQQYDQLYPQYVEFCGLTQYKEIGQEWGGL